MRTKHGGRALVAAALIAGLMVLGAPPAHAVFHLMKVREVFAGTAEQPTAQYIELQMYSANQTVVSGHDVKVFDANGEEVGSFAFTQAMQNGADGAYILVATTDAETAFGVTADLEMTPVAAAAGGKACFADDVDCVSWGAYKGDREGTGTPFNETTGLVAGQSMERKITGGDEADNLDAGDDTDDSAADFQSADPSPTNNAGEGPGSGGGGGGGEQAEHARSISLTLRKHVVAKGTVTVEDGTESCSSGVAVKVQRRKYGGWRAVGSTKTDETGNYKVKVPDKVGKYRALAPESEPSDTDRCVEAASPPKSHKH